MFHANPVAANRKRRVGFLESRFVGCLQFQRLQQRHQHRQIQDVSAVHIGLAVTFNRHRAGPRIGHCFDQDIPLCRAFEFHAVAQVVVLGDVLEANVGGRQSEPITDGVRQHNPTRAAHGAAKQRTRKIGEFERDGQEFAGLAGVHRLRVGIECCLHRRNGVLREYRAIQPQVARDFAEVRAVIASADRKFARSLFARHADVERCTHEAQLAIPEDIGVRRIDCLTERTRSLAACDRRTIPHRHRWQFR